MGCLTMKHDSSDAKHDPEGLPAGPEAELSALGWVRRARAETELLAEVAEQLRRRRRRMLSVLSSGAAVLLIAGLLWVRPDAGNVAPTASVSGPEWRRLPDGSAIELRNGAEIDVDFAGTARRVILRQGEAHFQVVKNERPFVVDAGGVKVQAVGTAFAVQLGSQQVEVLVTEGRVRIAPRLEAPPRSSLAEMATLAPAAEIDRPSSEPPVLTAGQRATISFDHHAPKIDAISEVELTDRLSWRIPNLEFSRTPLSEVVALMNQHGGGPGKAHFVIGDPELSDVTLSGFLRADNSEGLVRLLTNNFGVAAERSGTTIRLRRVR